MDCYDTCSQLQAEEKTLNHVAQVAHHTKEMLSISGVWFLMEMWEECIRRQTIFHIIRRKSSISNEHYQNDIPREPRLDWHLLSQEGPLNPSEQAQLKEARFDIHVPPLRQGLIKQRFSARNKAFSEFNQIIDFAYFIYDVIYWLP